MSKAPAMPMYWDAYLADTTHLTTEEHGAYMLLLAAMWRRNGSVPDDDKDNARILGLTPAKWRKVKARFVATISGFYVDGDMITQVKLLKTWKITQEKIAKNADNGAKGGRPKTKENKDLAKANGSSSHKPNQSIPEPEPEPEEEKKAYAQLAIAKGADQTPADVSSKPKKPSSRGNRLSPDWYLPKAWGEWALEAGASQDMIRSEADVFKDYWRGKSGKDGTKADWLATWRNWIRRAIERNGGKANGSTSRNSTERSERIIGAAAAGTTAKDWG